MALSDQELKEIAYLARINVKEESLPSLKKELEDILGLFKELDKVDNLKNLKLLRYGYQNI